MEWSGIAAIVTAASVLLTAIVGLIALFNTRKRDIAEMSNNFTSQLLQSERQCREDHRICTDHLAAAHQRLGVLEADNRVFKIQHELLGRLHTKETAGAPATASDAAP